ncbi:MAG: penicillin-binding protein 2 [Nitrospinaceae bacterium]|nr:penicillin-binding protein 2 [Nitrospinaceae bacterium]
MNQIKGRLTRKEHGSLKVRLILISILFALFAVGLAGRLFYLQVAMHEDLVLRSEKQYQRTVNIRYGRGSIFDRNMNELATNIDTKSVYATPHEVLGKKQAARTIASALNLSQKSVYEKLRSGRHFVWLKRKATPTEVTRLRNSSLSGVNFISEDKRFYPKRELASGAIGFVGIDNQGLAGIEHQFQSTLKGNTVRTVMEKDARGRLIRFGEGVGNQVLEDRGVVLTLDEVIQFFTEHHLKNQVEKYQAKSGIAVVMNPNTGEIYAIANIPQYNPNSYSIYQPQRWRNYAVSNAYEPGSIFKPIVAAAVIDSGAALPDDMFFCENGKFGIETRNGEATFGEADNHKFGWLTLQNIIVQSSNIGSIKIAQQLGQRSFYDYIRKFGFGQKSGVELPGEAPGKVRGLSSWGLRSLASISFGQEISVTPLQITAAMGAIANGGVLMTPRIAHAVINNGQVGDKFEPKTVRRVISVQTSRQMVDILKSVVKDGTGKKAAVKGYEVAGKTGTAQKYDPKTGGYSKTAFVSSFVGFVPADAAKVAILVMIDEPKGTHWGGSVAAPVFSSIARETLRYLNVPPSDQPADILERT